jgi:hypothetical protein
VVLPCSGRQSGPPPRGYKGSRGSSDGVCAVERVLPLLPTCMLPRLQRKLSASTGQHIRQTVRTADSDGRVHSYGAHRAGYVQQGKDQIGKITCTASFVVLCSGYGFIARYTHNPLHTLSRIHILYPTRAVRYFFNPKSVHSLATLRRPHQQLLQFLTDNAGVISSGMRDATMTFYAINPGKNVKGYFVSLTALIILK